MSQTPWVQIERSELRALEDAVKRERAETTRLRALVKAVEWKASDYLPENFEPCCVWCGWYADAAGHRDDCPAFLPDGTVR